MNKTKKNKAAAFRYMPTVEALRAQAIAHQKYLVNQLQHTFRRSWGMPIVNFTVTKPPAAGRAGFPRVGYRMELAQANDRVSIKAPATLVVSQGGPLNIQITVTGGLYYPIGIWFKKGPDDFGPNVDPNSNFPPDYQYHSGPNLNFTDAYLGYGDQYYFGLVIQNRVTGQLASIDPGIQHINDNVPSIAQ